MTATGKTILVVLVLLILGGGLYWSSQTEQPTPVDFPPGTGETPGDNIELVTITALHTFSDGTHMLSGQVTLPTPCHALNITSRVAESFPEQVMLDFKTTAGTGACIQVLASRPFTVSFQASPQAHISARWNDQGARLIMQEISETVLRQFIDKLRAGAVAEIGQPIEGFTPALFLQTYPGLEEADFAGVKAAIGIYQYANGQLTYDLEGERETHSAARAITDEGLATLLWRVANRLGVNLQGQSSVTTIISAIN